MFWELHPLNPLHIKLATGPQGVSFLTLPISKPDVIFSNSADQKDVFQTRLMRRLEGNGFFHKSSQSEGQGIQTDDLTYDRPSQISRHTGKQVDRQAYRQQLAG
jgi:hypothetical protein